MKIHTIHYRSNKFNNEDKKLVEFKEGMKTTRFITKFGALTMQNVSTHYEAVKLTMNECNELLTMLNDNLRKGFGEYFIA
jgi:hypothetical protein